MSGRLPTFIVIGAAKSGTTSLHDYLGQHPDVFMSVEKEPRFFAFDGRPPHFRTPYRQDGLTSCVGPGLGRLVRAVRSHSWSDRLRACSPMDLCGRYAF